MSMERWIPLGLRSPMRTHQYPDRSLDRPSSMFRRAAGGGAGPSWDVAPLDPRWDNLDMTIQQMDYQMKQMIRDMDHMFDNFMRIQPASSFGQWREDQALQNPIITAPDGSRNFRLSIDLSHFKPEEINVRTRDNMVEVHAKHEEESNGGRVFREYRRAFNLPKEVQPEVLKSTLSAAGLLALEAPVARAAIEQPREHVIPVKHEK